jgi:hypothetical protein
MLIAGLLLRRPDIDISGEDQRSVSIAVANRIESPHQAQPPEVSAEDVGKVPAPAEQTGSDGPNLQFLNGLFQ